MIMKVCSKKCGKTRVFERMSYEESKKIFFSSADIPHIFNGYLRFQTQIPNFLPIDILLAALRKFE